MTEILRACPFARVHSQGHFRVYDFKTSFPFSKRSDAAL